MLNTLFTAVSLDTLEEAVEAVVRRKGTPAYEILGYFHMLDSATVLSSYERDALEVLYERHRDVFVKRVLSLRTQWYMNTHHSKTSIEQSICSVLGIKYVPRL